MNRRYLEFVDLGSYPYHIIYFNSSILLDLYDVVYNIMISDLHNVLYNSMYSITFMLSALYYYYGVLPIYRSQELQGS